MDNIETTPKQDQNHTELVTRQTGSDQDKPDTAPRPVRKPPLMLLAIPGYTVEDVLYRLDLDKAVPAPNEYFKDAYGDFHNQGMSRERLIPRDRNL